MGLPISAEETSDVMLTNLKTVWKEEMVGSKAACSCADESNLFRGARNDICQLDVYEGFGWFWLPLELDLILWPANTVFDFCINQIFGGFSV